MDKITEQISEISTVIKGLNEILEDITVPRNVRTRLEIVVNTLKEDIELSIKVNRALNELDEISIDVNLKSYTRAQIWNIMSLLEKL